MGNIWAHEIPAYFEKWGVRTVYYEGWESRSRSSGGWDGLYGIGVHHTASAPTTSKQNEADYCWRNSSDRPIGNVILMRDGELWVGAAGASNTQGKGGPVYTSRGSIAQDNANRYMFSIEAANNGLGEPWPMAQVDVYWRTVCAIIDWASNETPGIPLNVGDIFAHFEWAPGRKYDPAGDSPYASDDDLWDMDAFRGDCLAAWSTVMEDNDNMDDEHFKQLIRDVLNEGTATGQPNWAGTVRETLGTIQRTFNEVKTVQGMLGGSRSSGPPYDQDAELDR